LHRKGGWNHRLQLCTRQRNGSVACIHLSETANKRSAGGGGSRRQCGNVREGALGCAVFGQLVILESRKNGGGESETLIGSEKMKLGRKSGAPIIRGTEYTRLARNGMPNDRGGLVNAKWDE